MDKFKNIEKSFESQQKLLEKDADKQTRYNQEETTDDSLGILKLVKHMPNTEIKNNFDIFKDIRIPNSQLNEENQEKREDDEYADYGRRNKNGIHFQLISDYNVSIEIVPEDILDSKIQSLLDQYKAVFDPSMKLWILPYVNYFPLYCDLVYMIFNLMVSNLVLNIIVDFYLRMKWA